MTTFIAYIILHMIGQEIVRQRNAPAKRIDSRKRVCTVIQNLIHFANHITTIHNLRVRARSTKKK